MFNKQTFSFLSSNGKDEVAAYLYQPNDCEPRLIIQISHGMCEYVERYEPFIDFLTSQGFLVCGNDHLGHGHTAKTDEDLGFFGEKEGYKYLVEDLYFLTQKMRNDYPELPIILYGHSMGSMVARCYLSKYGSKLDGCILSGTVGPNPVIGVAKLLCGMQMKKLTPRGRSELLNNIGFGSYNKRIKGNRTIKDWLSRDPEVVDRYIKDKYCMFSFTTAGFRDLLAMTEIISTKQWPGTVPKELPILLYSGEEDPVGSYGKGVRIVYERLKSAGIKDLEVKLYPEARHEMHNEVNKEEVYADVLKWCEHILQKQPIKQ